jgi:hypothetical protein
MHLGDEVLAGAALQQHTGDDTLALSPAAHAHLARCGRCAARLDALCLQLAGQRDLAVAAADAQFSESRLAAQRDRILAQLAARHAGARVLIFPTPTPAPPQLLPRPQQAGMRWVAATLAAGLFVGAMTGQVLYTRDLLVRHVVNQQAQQQAPHIPRYHQRWTAESGPDAQPGDERDERLLGEIESAIAQGRRRNPALRALDDLTPHASGTQPRRQYP